MPTPLTVFITAADLDTFIGTDEHTRRAAAGLTPERYAQTISDVNDEIAGVVGGRTNLLRKERCSTPMPAAVNPSPSLAKSS